MKWAQPPARLSIPHLSLADRPSRPPGRFPQTTFGEVKSIFKKCQSLQKDEISYLNIKDLSLVQNKEVTY